MVDTISNMQLSDLNYNPHGGKRLQNLIDRVIGTRFYPPPGSLHCQLLRLGKFLGPTNINCEQKKKSEIKRQKYPVHAIVLRKPVHILYKKTAHF